jgi:phage terminase large subunit-like protein
MGAGGGAGLSPISASRLVAEVNQGGELVEVVMRQSIR